MIHSNILNTKFSKVKANFRTSISREEQIQFYKRIFIIFLKIIKITIFNIKPQ